MTITEFADSRGVKVQAVNNYIKRHSSEFQGHSKKVGNARELDEVAIEILNKKYPLPRPVEIIEDKESREKLIKALERLDQMRDSIENLRIELYEAEKKALLNENAVLRLEDKEKEVEALTIQLEVSTSELESTKGELKSTRAELEVSASKLESAKAEIDRLNNRSLIERILNK